MLIVKTILEVQNLQLELALNVSQLWSSDEYPLQDTPFIEVVSTRLI